MSGSDKSDKEDLLDKLLGSAHGTGQPSTNPASTGIPADKQPGLNPLDLLDLPTEQRDLINWLARRKQARFDDLLEGLVVEPAHLTALLSALKRAQYIQETPINGEIYYRVLFGGKVSRAARGLAEFRAESRRSQRKAPKGLIIMRRLYAAGARLITKRRK